MDCPKNCFEPIIAPDQLIDQVTCDCGHGYFTEDKQWISGWAVRMGKAPPRPSKEQTPPFNVCLLLLSGHRYHSASLPVLDHVYTA